MRVPRGVVLLGLVLPRLSAGPGPGWACAAGKTVTDIPNAAKVTQVQKRVRPPMLRWELRHGHSLRLVQLLQQTAGLNPLVSRLRSRVALLVYKQTCNCGKKVLQSM